MKLLKKWHFPDVYFQCKNGNTKGQWIYGVLNSPKKIYEKNQLYYYDTSGQTVFVRFLGEMRKPLPSIFTDFYHSPSQISRVNHSLFALEKISPLTNIPPPLFIITLYFLQGDPFICDQFLWTHWKHWGYCVVCNHEKTAEIPSTNVNAFSIWLILRHIEFHALCLTQSKFNFCIL